MIPTSNATGPSRRESLPTEPKTTRDSDYLTHLVDICNSPI
jgi:hypothetical protein